MYSYLFFQVIASIKSQKDGKTMTAKMKKGAQVTFWDPVRRRKDLKKEPMGNTTGDVHGTR